MTVTTHDTVIALAGTPADTISEGWGKQTVFFATDRQPVGNWHNGDLPIGEELFGHARAQGRDLFYGIVQVSIPKGHRQGEVDQPGYFTLMHRSDPRRYMETVWADSMSAAAFYGQLRQKRDASAGGALVYIHGFNNTFQSAVLRTAQIAHDLNFKGPAIAYSWPARNNALLYVADRNDAEWSAAHLRQFLDSLAVVMGNRPIHIIAHSTGAFVLARALQLQPGTPTLRLDKLILAAPDLDAAVFKNQILPVFRSIAARTTLYASSHDIPLFLSRELGGGSQRAGEIKPDPVVAPGLDTIDASSGSIDLLGHSIAFEDRALLDDLYYLVVRNTPPEKRNLRPQHAQGGTVWVVP
jgi:esterase/lipase superfamily enzyme